MDMKSMLIRTNNASATEFYYNIIADALRSCSELVFDGFEGDKLPTDHKDALVITGTCTSAFLLWMKGYRNIVTWYQGVLPEESLMRNHSKLRFWILGMIERFSLNHDVLHIFTSESMREFYEGKYRIKLGNYYTMPCFNASFQPQLILDKKYDGKTFTYTGGLSNWQCIDQTLALYKRIEQRSGNTTKLLLLTPEQDKAREMVKTHHIVNADIKCVHYTQLPDALKEVSFGFALREDNPVNRVATPTKLANYIANGIIPVYSSCLRDFFRASSRNPYQIVIEDVNHATDAEVDMFISQMNQMPAAQDVVKNFGEYFETYYNAQWHAEQLAGMIRKIDTI